MVHPHIDLLRPALAAGLEWLYETEQPPGAVLSHHGVDLRVPEANRRLSLVPSGYRSLPVVVVEVLEKTYEPRTGPQYPRLTNGLERGEIAQIVQVIESLGCTVDTIWNARPGSSSGSIGLLAPAGPSLRPVQAYRRHCPTHRTVFCGHSPERGGHNCSWYRDGRALVVEPTVPTAALEG